MSSLSKISLRTKIRSRINVIEKNVVKYLHSERIRKIREKIRKELDLEDEEKIKTGIVKPTIFTKDIFT
ncbi:uncharacterized protein VNE69_10159 [Vairimorpha necatrix]|uniref:Uncharacterized protein n=1 Tax=Vairimorpha necatrix TaxID=6039 RepID=A0AAX4JFQ7_9MICR